MVHCALVRMQCRPRTRPDSLELSGGADVRNFMNFSHLNLNACMHVNFPRCTCCYKVPVSPILRLSHTYVIDSTGD